MFTKQEQLLTDKRIKLDKMLSNTNSIKFFISCITGTSTSGKEKFVGVTPGVSYFIVFDHKIIKEDVIYAKFHDIDGINEDFQLKSMKRKSLNSKNEILSHLTRTVKVKIFLQF